MIKASRVASWTCRCALAVSFTATAQATEAKTTAAWAPEMTMSILARFIEAT